MPAEVKILIEGYTNANEVSQISEEQVCSTITLIRDENSIIVVDPGVLKNQQALIDALEKENLTVQDVDIVCITHSHLDHYRNIGMFPNAKTLEYFGLWEEDKVQHWKEQFSTNIQVLHTPGHDYSGITLFVTTADGVVAICGDVFWKENYPMTPQEDAFASNPDKLRESRDMILRMADWIVPGHGPIYKNDKNIESEKKKKEKSENYLKKAKESKIVVICKKCGKQMKQKDKCQCRPYLCFRCCECGLDCNLCGCSHKR
jgi:glyoxylase-like metal-dependent hydrolase (beta-lactamase superfamily II)